MHLALISTSFPDQELGSEAAGSFVSDFAEELSRHFRVTVIAPSMRESTVKQGKLRIRRFPVPDLPLSLLRATDPTHWVSIIKTLRSGQSAVEEIVRESGIDHTFALWALPSGYWARNIWKSYNIPYSIWALGSDIWSFEKLPLVKNYLRAVLQDCSACFADGYLLKNDVERISGRECEFLPSVRNLIVNDKRTFANNPPYRFAYLGRWHPNKGIDLLLESLGLLTNEDWAKIEEIRICGGGPLEEHVKNACVALNADGRPINVSGYLDKNRATQLLLWADYLFLPSRIESIPVVFSDAIQIGCPLIATPVGDLPRLKDETLMPGILASDVSPVALCRAIQKALEKPPGLYASSMERAQEYFDLKKSVTKFVKSIES